MREKFLRVQFRFSTVYAPESQTSLNIMLKTYFGRKKFTKKVKPCIPPHTFLIILEHNQEAFQLKKATDFQQLVIKSRKVMTKKVIDLSLYMLLFCKIFF